MQQPFVAGMGHLRCFAHGPQRLGASRGSVNLSRAHVNRIVFVAQTAATSIHTRIYRVLSSVAKTNPCFYPIPSYPKNDTKLISQEITARARYHNRDFLYDTPFHTDTHGNQAGTARKEGKPLLSDLARQSADMLAQSENGTRSYDQAGSANRFCLVQTPAH